MRVVHVATGALPVEAESSRSVERSLHRLTNSLADLGCDVDIVDIRTGSTRDSRPVKYHEVQSLPFHGAGPLSYFLKVVWFSLRLLPVLRGFAGGKATVIHAHSQFPAAAVLLARRLFRWKVPVVYTAHNPYLLAPSSLTNRLRHLLIEGWVLRKADRVIAQTESVGRELGRRFRVAPARFARVYDGVDIEAVDAFVRHHPVAGNGQKTVFYPAIINPRKNQAAVVESIPRILEACPGCRFVFAGSIDDRPYFDHLQKLVREYGISPYVEFTGQLPTEPLYQQYRSATVFVFPTRYETQGIVLVEAMAFGLPVIASRIGPVMDVVGLEEGSAVLVDPNDTEEISSAIIRLLRDEAARAALSARGRKLASSRFPWSRTARDMLAVYQDVVGDSHSEQAEA